MTTPARKPPKTTWIPTWSAVQLLIRATTSASQIGISRGLANSGRTITSITAT
jgi:hypothetical protein